MIVEPMIITLDNTITIKWAGRNREHYESLGYEWGGNFAPFDVPIKDLHPSTRVEIMVMCPVCNDVYNRRWELIGKLGHTICKQCTKTEDLRDQRFGRLTPVHPLHRDYHKNLGHTNRYWLCKCDCGEYANVMGRRLVDGTATSCGCYRRERMSQIASGRFGSLNNSWNPNLTDEQRNESRRSEATVAWEKAIKKRDDYTCVICGKRTLSAIAHHLDGWAENPDKRFDLDNGVCLCLLHHKDFHTKYGYGNNTLEQFHAYVESYRVK